MTETRDLLIEIGTEELPPGSLATLARDFHDRFTGYMISNDLLDNKCKTFFYFSPRRLALIAENIPVQQPEKDVERFGPAVNVAFDKNGKPTRSAEGFARSCGVEVDALQEKNGKLFYVATQKGKPAVEIIPDAISDAISKLQIPKRMRWGTNTTGFIRPVHWVVVLYGNQTVPCEILGVKSGNKTFGHRYHHPEAIKLHSPGEYRETLKKAKVCVNETCEYELQQHICSLAQELASEVNGIALNSDRESNLVRENAALVEWPVALRGSFDEKFLVLPEELLISVLEDQQRYFAVRDKKSGNLLPYFIAISNIESTDKEKVRKGNERVIVPRLSDAMFFWETDKSRSLESRQSELDGIVFQEKLGSIGNKTGSVLELSKIIAKKLGVNPQPVMRAASLSKCDLVTDMVGEFPELQGITGKYLAQQDGEDSEVALAIEEHYLPRFSGDHLPETQTGQILALADKMYTLAGIFGIGQQPTGDRDPFALRRAALGVVRILVEKKLPLSISDLVHDAYTLVPDTADQAQGDLTDFILDRARGYFAEQGNAKTAIEAVIQPFGAKNFLYTLPEIISEATDFISSEEGKLLAESNKRITNILKKSGFEIPFSMKPSELKQKPDEKLFSESAEKIFWNDLQKFGKQSIALKDDEKFAESLRVLTNLAGPTRIFFDTVMVNVEDEKIRNNRITLLQYARVYMNQVAELSLMAG